VAVIARFPIDNSAAARMNHPDLAARLTPLIEGAVVATCATLDADVLHSARSAAEYEQLRADRRRDYKCLPTEDRHWRRAFDVQRELARTDRRGAVGVADRLTAVIACEHRITLVHYDSDLDTAAKGAQPRPQVGRRPRNPLIRRTEPDRAVLATLAQDRPAYRQPA
jgi:predicted nucleic acid-binding protein